MKNLFFLLLLCVSAQLQAQTMSAKDLIRDGVIVDTLYYCPPRTPRKILPKPFVAPVPCTYTQVKDTAGINVTVINKIYNNLAQRQDTIKPDVNMTFNSDINNRNLYLKKGTIKEIIGLGCFTGAGVCAFIGSSRHYSFHSLTSSNVVQYKHNNIISTINVNDVDEVIRGQERCRRAWYYAAGGLFVAGVGFEIWGICDNQKLKIIITPDGAGFTFNF